MRQEPGAPSAQRSPRPDNGGTSVANGISASRPVTPPSVGLHLPDKFARSQMTNNGLPRLVHNMDKPFREVSNMDYGQGYPISELSLIFPELAPEEYDRLVTSIRQEGLLDPIAVWRGEVIDGRHRLAACAEAGVKPRYHHLPDDADPVQYVLARNAFRRHLSESQRAVVAYRLPAHPNPGHPRTAGGNCANLRNLTQGEAAEAPGVSRRLVTHAARALDQPPEVQRQAVELVLKGEARNLSRALRHAHEETARRQEQDQLEPATMSVGDAVTLHQATVAGLAGLVAPGSVDAIITHPPHDDRYLSLFSDLAGFAAHALEPAGFMVVVASGMLLQPIMERLRHPDLRWIGEFDLLFHGDPLNSGPRTGSVYIAVHCSSTGRPATGSTVAMTCWRFRRRLTGPQAGTGTKPPCGWSCHGSPAPGRWCAIPSCWTGPGRPWPPGIWAAPSSAPRRSPPPLNAFGGGWRNRKLLDSADDAAAAGWLPHNPQPWPSPGLPVMHRLQRPQRPGLSCRLPASQQHPQVPHEMQA